MRSSRFFWKLVLSCAGLNLVAAVIVGLVISSLLPDQEAGATVARRWVWGLVAGESLVVFAVSYWLMGIITRPMPLLIQAADAIASGDYQHRVYVPNRDELGIL